MQEDPNHPPPGPEVQSLQNPQVNLINFTLYHALYYQSQHLLYYVNCLWNLCSTCTLFLLKLQNVICSHSCIELKPHFITNTLLKVKFFGVFFFICRLCQKASFCLSQSGESPTENKETRNGCPAGCGTDPEIWNLHGSNPDGLVLLR